MNQAVVHMGDIKVIGTFSFDIGALKVVLVHAPMADQLWVLLYWVLLEGCDQTFLATLLMVLSKLSKNSLVPTNIQPVSMIFVK